MNQTVFLHETDSHGFPLCRCPACRAQSKIINDRQFARMFGEIFKSAAGHDEQQEKLDRDQDYADGMK